MILTYWSDTAEVEVLTYSADTAEFYKTNPETSTKCEWFDFSSQGKTDTGDTPQPDSPADLPPAADLFNKGISIQGEQILLT